MDRALTHVTSSSRQQRNSQPTGMKTDERGTHHHLQRGGTDQKRGGESHEKKVKVNEWAIYTELQYTHRWQVAEHVEGLLEACQRGQG
jgi:hypothetical protein